MSPLRAVTDSIENVWVCSTHREDDPDSAPPNTTAIACCSAPWSVLVWGPPNWVTALSDDQLRRRIEAAVRLCVRERIPLGTAD